MQRDAPAAKAVLHALKHGAADQAPLGRFLAGAPDWTALRSLRQDAAVAGWHGPVQAALCRVALAHGIAALHEAQARLHRDAPLLAERFGFRANALMDVEGLGDPHAGGRRVLRMERMRTDGPLSPSCAGWPMHSARMRPGSGHRPCCAGRAMDGSPKSGPASRPVLSLSR